jgi:hypothetical protein
LRQPTIQSEVDGAPAPGAKRNEGRVPAVPMGRPLGRGGVDARFLTVQLPPSANASLTEPAAAHASMSSMSAAGSGASIGIRFNINSFTSPLRITGSN